MQPFAQDWAFARAGVSELQAYLLSKELYWQLSPLKEDRAAGRLPSLTPGNLLLSMRKLGALEWSGDQRSAFRVLEKQYTALRAQWRSAWLQKANREGAARLKLWQDYLEESAREGGRLVDYPFQLRWRTVIDLLVEDGVELPLPQAQVLHALDERLRILTQEAPFAWEDSASTVFPPDRFWYLYRVQKRK